MVKTNLFLATVTASKAVKVGVYIRISLGKNANEVAFYGSLVLQTDGS